jgi:hypothetical protein
VWNWNSFFQSLDKESGNTLETPPPLGPLVGSQPTVVNFFGNTQFLGKHLMIGRTNSFSIQTPIPKAASSPAVIVRQQRNGAA